MMASSVTRLSCLVLLLALAAGGLSSAEATEEAGTAATAELPGLTVSGVGSDDVPELFSRGLSAYEEGSYGDAVAAFMRLVELQPGNGALLYNLGNAQLRNGELGIAIASYRRARRLLPRDRDLLANLEFARSTTRDALGAPDPGPLLRTVFFWHHSLSPSERAVLAVLLSVVFWLTLGLWLGGRRRAGVQVLAAGAAAALLALLASTVWSRFLSTEVAVVVPQEVDALTAPRDDGVVRFKVHAGTELRVVEDRAAWLRIELPDGERGWVEQQFVVRAP